MGYTMTSLNENDEPFDDVFIPHEAAVRLYQLSAELEKHDLAPELVEELRLISQRFSRHFEGLEAFVQSLRDTVRALQW